MGNEDFEAAMQLLNRRKKEKTEEYYLDLQESEKLIVETAASIYAAYIQSGQVKSGMESEFQNRAIREAVQIALSVEKLISDAGEVRTKPA